MGACLANHPNCGEAKMKPKYKKVGKRTYSHNSILRLIDSYSQISQDPEKIIRSLVHEKIAAARNLGWTGPPFDPRILASIMGIHYEESRELIRSKDAELHPTGNGRSVIKYNPDRPRARQNFSIAHEIGHTFFPEYEDQVNARHEPGRFDPESELEYLCDLGASEIVLPSPEFDIDVRQLGISLKSLNELSTRYQASREATAIRMIGTDIFPCALMMLDYKHKPTEFREIEASKYQLQLFDDVSPVAPPMKLRVQFCVRSHHFTAFIPTHKSIDESSPLYEVSVTHEVFQGDVCLDLKNQILEFYAEAMPMPSVNGTGLGSRVLAILFQR